MEVKRNGSTMFVRPPHSAEGLVCKTFGNPIKQIIFDLGLSRSNEVGEQTIANDRVISATYTFLG